MLRQLETALLARLKGTDVAPRNPIMVPPETITDAATNVTTRTGAEEVRVSMMLPSDWVNSNIYPGINVWRVDMSEDRSRFRTGIHRKLAADGNSIQYKNHQLPARLIYEVGIRARYNEQLVRIVEEVERRLPPMGYGSFLKVTITDGIVVIPFDKTSFADTTDREATGERDFEVRITYAFDAWTDVDSWKSEKTVRRVVMDFNGEETIESL